MKFSDRRRLADEFTLWLNKTNSANNLILSNEPLNVITFLDKRGLLNENHIYERSAAANALWNLYRKLETPHMNGKWPQSVSLSRLKKEISKMVEELQDE